MIIVNWLSYVLLLWLLSLLIWLLLLLLLLLGVEVVLDDQTSVEVNQHHHCKVGMTPGGGICCSEGGALSHTSSVMSHSIMSWLDIDR